VAKNTKTSRTIPTGVVDVSVVGDSTSAARMIEGLNQAFSPYHLGYDFLQDHVHDRLVERARQRFADEGDEVVGAWPALADATVAIRQSKGFGGPHPINVRTGEMKRHILDSRPSIVPLPDGAVMTTPGGEPGGDLGKKLQTAQSGDNRTPARPVIGVGVRDLEEILLQLAVHMREFQPGGGQGLLS
jgi:hypothetical protein